MTTPIDAVNVVCPHNGSLFQILYKLQRSLLFDIPLILNFQTTNSSMFSKEYSYLDDGNLMVWRKSLASLFTGFNICSYCCLYKWTAMVVREIIVKSDVFATWG